MFCKFIAKATTQVIKYQFRSLIATSIIKNNHLNIHNLIAFKFDILPSLQEEKEKEINELLTMSCRLRL
ncbi:unnamed protein product (macronuclear) [Paramecium tetraurelia]|uniref:Uncharacterized protein n=1 Tax=Paramecium tetraurelia TaxID=5888 RepID=A0DLI8_PARTE|nr:uncharacterized protein GSPATT00018222001 [Paramecium tetraurelia]CAK83905.1 unnamed protein product [Paramecium tetraurelia]|eukprot:XP_001451302.1 hypothetical protein (macronuclear) [Paramecium tetraurelia strain d4-2]